MSKKIKPKKNQEYLEATNNNKIRIVPPPSAMNVGQKNLLTTIADPENSIIFVSGIAGSGKTFCSVSWGIEQFFKGKFRKLIFTRPTVEAGESMGYLPGTCGDKILPYLLPIFDVLEKYISTHEIKLLVAENKIITLPINFMRGSTFTDSFVVLDEAQNTTTKQMHLFLTRIGKGSKMVITGDLSQSDLGKNNGFADAINRLDTPDNPIEGLKHVVLDPDEVVRHRIIPIIDKRYH